MASPKKPSREDLEKLKLQAEIDKILAEKQLAERQINEVWYSGRSLRVIASTAITAVTIAALFYTYLVRPISTYEDRLASIKATVAEAGLDSLAIARRQLAATVDSLAAQNALSQARLDSLRIVETGLKTDNTRQAARIAVITARLDSIEIEREDELDSAIKALASERAKSQTNQKRVQELAAQVSALQRDIKQAAAEKREIKRIAMSPDLSEEAVAKMLKENSLFCRGNGLAWANLDGEGVKNRYRQRADGRVVFDATTGLLWQRSGSERIGSHDDAKWYVEGLNRYPFADYSGWRLPTLQEAMSLVESSPNQTDLYIDGIFSNQQKWIWTADMLDSQKAWHVNFVGGLCIAHSGGSYVRAVIAGLKPPPPNW